MARDTVHLVSASVLILLVMGQLAEAARNPPGLSDDDGDSPGSSGSTATCKNTKFKECHNLVHVCPKKCGDSGCHVHCRSCKPICGPDDGSSDDDEPTTPAPTPVTPAPVYPTPTPTPVTPSPTPVTPAPTPVTPSPTPVTPAPTPVTPSPTPVTPAPVTPSPTPVTPSPTPVTPSPVTPSPTPVTPTPPTVPTPTPVTPTPSTPTYPPGSGVSAKKRSRCRNSKYPKCYNVEHACPAACPTGCVVDCVSCKPMCSCDQPGAVCQDPRFVGGDGITFYFHGKQNRDFCLLSDSNLHINGHFIGKRNQNMNRDFTWVQAIGVLFNDHQIYVGAQKTATWDDSVDRVALSFDGQPIYLPELEGAKWQSEVDSSISITRSGVTNRIIIEVEGNFKITANVVPITEEESRIHNYAITSEDCFAHLDLAFKFYSLSEDVNGVLGQTYAKNYVSRVKMGAAMPVMGGDNKFITSNLFAKDCAVARFIGSESTDTGSSSEYGSLNCSSGIDGTGVVCKR
ncbi:hypothetical protein MKW92_041457 [Papaver armeniacum]|nr:hypothetical protein MKW92_041457 [Papaver armeniacum]